MKTMTENQTPVYRIRAELGMTQEGFAQFLGYRSISSGVRAISRWEAGRQPRGESLQRLCSATGKRAGFFLGIDDDEEEALARQIENGLAALEFMRQQRQLAKALA